MMKEKGGEKMAGSSHNTIIKQLCRERLLPLGLFQKGSSRIYIDDNGYFFTVIEFQPSGFAKGTYLNIALHFLWNERAYIAYDFPFGQQIRVRDFVEYQNDAQFEKAVAEYIDAAITKITFYRRLANIKRAQRYAWLWKLKYRKNKNVHELDKLRRLHESEILQQIKSVRAFWRDQASMKNMKYYEEFDA